MLIKLSFTILLSLIVFSVSAQKNGDKKIIIALADTINIYEKLKAALSKNDFLIREDGNKDTVTTHLREFRTMPGYCSLKAILKGNTVTISGIYALKKMNVFGLTTAPRDYKQITYFGGSKSWSLLMSVANALKGQVTFTK